MGAISDFIEKRAGWGANDERWWQAVIGGRSIAGVNVSETTALNSTAVYACVRLLADTIGTLPLFYYRRLARGKERAVDHELFSILHDSPNPEMSSADMRTTMQGHIELWGNAYAEIQFNPNGRIKALWPLRPDRMKVARLDDGALLKYNLPAEAKGQLIYEYTTGAGIPHTFPSWKILHIPGLGFDGVKGYSPITMARQAIGLTMATEEFGARFFGNGTNIGGFFEHPGKLSIPAHDRLKKDLQEKYAGLDKSNETIVLEEGMKFTKLGIPPNDAQFLETRKFQLNEIARFFGIPPHMVGDLEKSTSWGTGIEQQNIAFLEYTLRPRLVRWEQRITLRLTYPEDRGKYFAEHLIDGLMRGDSAARGEFYNKLFQMGSISPNDIREKENFNPVDGGDKTYIPLNMTPVNSANDDVEPAVDDVLTERMIKSFSTVFQEALERIIKHEKDTVGRAARKYFVGGGRADFLRWMVEYYAQFPDYAGKQMTPAARSITEIAAKIESDFLHLAELGETDIAGFVARYIENFAIEYIRQLTEALKAAETLEAVELILEGWEQERAGIAANDGIRSLIDGTVRLIKERAGIN